jgi:hypothetical protein
MTWFVITNWVFVAAILFVVLNRKRPPVDEMIWTGVLCLLWPVLLLFFLVGTALWFAGAIYHSIKRRRWEF